MSSTMTYSQCCLFQWWNLDTGREERFQNDPFCDELDVKSQLSQLTSMKTETTKNRVPTQISEWKCRTFQDLIYQTISTYFYIVSGLGLWIWYQNKTLWNYMLKPYCHIMTNANVTVLLHNLLHRGLTRAPQRVYSPDYFFSTILIK